MPALGARGPQRESSLGTTTAGPICKPLGWELGEGHRSEEFEEQDKQACCIQGFNLSPSGQGYPINTGKSFIASEPGTERGSSRSVTDEAPRGLWADHFFRSSQDFEN